MGLESSRGSLCPHEEARVRRGPPAPDQIERCSPLQM